MVAMAVALLAIVVAAWRYTDGNACREWQERYDAARPPDGGQGVFDFVNMGPLAALRDERPAGCPIP
jgi:hypothetical protein